MTLRASLLLLLTSCLSAESQSVSDCECGCVCSDDSEPEGACDASGCCESMCVDLCADAGAELANVGEACAVYE